MRKHKFRAWIKDQSCGGGFMLYPHDNDTDYAMISNGDEFGVVDGAGNWLKSDDYVVMEYINRCDKIELGDR